MWSLLLSGLLLTADEGSPVRLETARPDAEPGIDPEDEERPWDVGLELDFLSQYAFRGFLITEGPVMQPYLHVNYKRLTLDGYANMNLDERDYDRGRFNEYVGEVYWTLDLGDLAVQPGFTCYCYPLDEEDSDTGEFFLLLAHPVGPLEVELLNSVDVVTFPGYWYASLAVQYDWVLTDRLVVEARVSADYASDPNEDEDEYAVIVPELSVSLFLTEHLYVRPHATFSHFVYSAFEPDDDNIFVWGIAAGVSF